MKILLILLVYIIGVVISSVIFSRFFFKYNDPKDCFGLIKPDVNDEQEHYSYVVIISWIYPLTWFFIIIYLIYNTLINFTIWMNRNW